MELEDENPFGLDSFSPKVDDYGFAKTLTSSTSSSSNVGSQIKRKSSKVYGTGSVNNGSSSSDTSPSSSSADTSSVDNGSISNINGSISSSKSRGVDNLNKSSILISLKSDTIKTTIDRRNSSIINESPNTNTVPVVRNEPGQKLVMSNYFPVVAED